MMLRVQFFFEKTILLRSTTQAQGMHGKDQATKIQTNRKVTRLAKKEFTNVPKDSNMHHPKQNQFPQHQNINTKPSNDK